MKKNSNKPQKRGRSERKVVSFLDELKSEVAALFEINPEKSFTLQEVLEHFNAEDKKLRLMLDGILQDLRD